MTNCMSHGNSWRSVSSKVSLITRCVYTQKNPPSLTRNPSWPRHACSSDKIICPWWKYLSVRDHENHSPCHENNPPMSFHCIPISSLILHMIFIFVHICLYTYMVILCRPWTVTIRNFWVSIVSTPRITLMMEREVVGCHLRTPQKIRVRDE